MLHINYGHYGVVFSRISKRELEEELKNYLFGGTALRAGFPIAREIERDNFVLEYKFPNTAKYDEEHGSFMHELSGLDFSDNFSSTVSFLSDKSKKVSENCHKYAVFVGFTFKFIVNGNDVNSIKFRNLLVNLFQDNNDFRKDIHKSLELCRPLTNDYVEINNFDPSIEDSHRWLNFEFSMLQIDLR